jgi:NAD-dependent deacetylase
VATISFGQPMREEDMIKASNASKTCDLMLVIGSSLKVMPAGKIPGLAITSGAKVVILNRDKTRYDSKADVVVNDELENICSELNHLF